MTRPPRALVTGAAGFVGRVLADRLRREDWTVRALLRAPACGPWDDSVTCDLASERIPAQALDGVDAVFHLAGKAHAVGAVGESDEDYAVNVTGTSALLAASRAAGTRCFVFVSSVKAASPDGPYGRSKLRAEQAVLDASGGSPRVSVVRPVLVYGPGVKGNLEQMMHAVDRRRFPPLAETGNRRSMVHVHDLAAALLLCATSAAAEGRTYVVTDGVGYSTRTLYVEMSRALGRPVAPWHLPVGLLRTGGRAGDVASRLTGRRAPLTTAVVRRLVESAEYDGSAIRRELGFRPTRDLRSALPEMVAAYRENASQL